MDRSDLRKALEALEGSSFFLILLTGSLLLSLRSLYIQRRQVRAALNGEGTEGFPSVFPLQKGASALVIGSLGFFFCLALTRLGQAEEGDDPVEGRSARTNALASALVLAAALLRLDDLLFVRASRQTALPDTEDQPPF